MILKVFHTKPIIGFAFKTHLIMPLHVCDLVIQGGHSGTILALDTFAMASFYPSLNRIWWRQIVAREKPAGPGHTEFRAMAMAWYASLTSTSRDLLSLAL